MPCVDGDVPPDPAGDWLPLVSQEGNGTVTNTTVLEQPLDLTTLAQQCVCDTQCGIGSVCVWLCVAECLCVWLCVSVAGRYDDGITDFITDNAEKPFFLYVPFNQYVS